MSKFGLQIGPPSMHVGLIFNLKYFIDEWLSQTIFHIQPAIYSLNDCDHIDFYKQKSDTWYFVRTAMSNRNVLKVLFE